MTREEFLALPPAVALAIIYDSSPGIQKLVDAAEKPRLPLPPKYDTRVPRKDGFAWASEMTLSDLQWWLQHKRERAATGNQYAEKDAKLADKLERWVAWRETAPSAAWQGQRNDEAVTAAPPAGRAPIHRWPDRGEVTTPLPQGGYGDGNDDDKLPF